MGLECSGYRCSAHSRGVEELGRAKSGVVIWVGRDIGR